MRLSEYYQQQCHAGLVQADAGQQKVVAALQRVTDELVAVYHQRRGLLSRLRQAKLVKGLYLYGGVGIGKTFLMDCFYQQLPFDEKLRLHFHAFMQYIHHELKHYQGKKDPVAVIAKTLAKQYRVICFDEFVVTDIVDAMLLKNLLQALFSHGVCLVATSNTAPDELYKNGLQRTSFLPAIALLKQHTEVYHLASQLDYRLMQLRKSGVYFTPDNEASHLEMEKVFSIFVKDGMISVDPLMILDRPIHVMKTTQRAAWFHFQDLCQPPRSQHDYLQLAKTYQVIFLSHIPVLAANDKNTIVLFIKLIDVFYDARIPVIFSAAVPAHELGRHLSHVADFARTQSRLMEMQSEKYFAERLFIS